MSIPSLFFIVSPYIEQVQAQVHALWLTEGKSLSEISGGYNCVDTQGQKELPVRASEMQCDITCVSPRAGCQLLKKLEQESKEEISKEER